MLSIGEIYPCLSRGYLVRRTFWRVVFDYSKCGNGAGLVKKRYNVPRDATTVENQRRCASGRRIEIRPNPEKFSKPAAILNRKKSMRRQGLTINMPEGAVVKQSKESTMGVHHKKPRSAGLSVLIYDRILHPELFAADVRRARVMGDFDVNLWLLTGGGHMAAISGAHTFLELTCFPNKALPERGLIEKLPCKGDKQFDLALGDDYYYYLALNEEHVTEALFENSVTEMLRLAQEQDGLVAHRKNDLGRTEYLSVLVTQLHRRAIHIEGFHLLGEVRALIRTQSILEPIRR